MAKSTGPYKLLARKSFRRITVFNGNTYKLYRKATAQSNTTKTSLDLLSCACMI